MVFDNNAGLGISRDALLAKLATTLSPKRFAHVKQVADAAKQLAVHWGYAAVEKAELAGLLHDYAKEASDDVFISLIHKYKLDPDLLNWHNNVWHGVVGIYKIQEDFGITDPELLRAI
ncbi:MAG: HD domain-containing protein, partial [Lactococcus sp.]|nr:HD domain-containing protein [Lactococcus sp.]